MSADLTNNELLELLQQSREYARYLGELGVSTAPNVEIRPKDTGSGVVSQSIQTQATVATPSRPLPSGGPTPPKSAQTSISAPVKSQDFLFGDFQPAEA